MQASGMQGIRPLPSGRGAWATTSMQVVDLQVVELRAVGFASSECPRAALRALGCGLCFVSSSLVMMGTLCGGKTQRVVWASVRLLASGSFWPST